MVDQPAHQRGIYFEGFYIGQSISTVGRTVTESDIVTFAGLSGDYNQIHTDAEFSKTSFMGQRVAHGLLVLSIVSGLAMRTGFLEGTVIAFREIINWKFLRPVYINDTIHVEMVVAECKALPRLKAGSVKVDVLVKNQSNELVMRGAWLAIVASDPRERV